MSKQASIVVTGAAGHLGSHLVPALLEAGFAIRGVDMADPQEPLCQKSWYAEHLRCLS